MPQPASRAAAPLPTWLVVAGTLAIVYHFAGIVIGVLNVPSGPWPSQNGAAAGSPPNFASSSADLVSLSGKYFRVAHSFHFDGNRPADWSDVQFEVRLRDDDGKVFKTLKFPDPDANPWVRHRQELLAHQLATDQPMPPQEGEQLAAAGSKPLTEVVWLMDGEKIDRTSSEATAPTRGNPFVLQMKTVPRHLVPRTRDVFQPSKWELLLVKSYGRYLCRENGAATAEIVRKSRNPINPAVLYGTQVAPNEPSNPYNRVFDEMTATFEGVSR